MNHLAHFALTDNSPDTLVGSFLGDYVKGRLKGEYPHAVERGIRLHRAIDAFTDSHPIVKRSHLRFDRAFYRYGGIMTDIIYDYFLARSWQRYHHTALHQFSRQTLATLLAYRHTLPGRANRTAVRMYEMNALAGYGSEAYIERSFIYLSNRLTRRNPLDLGFLQFLEHRHALKGDFADFYPELSVFSRDWMINNPRQDQLIESRNASETAGSASPDSVKSPLAYLEDKQ